jgi:23S rRNA (guanosine2251-2'-O)-methyltransferase
MHKTNNETDIVFGIHPIQEAILADKEIERVLVQKGLRSPALAELLKTCSDRNIPFSQVPPEKLNRITRKAHQGVIAFITSVSYASLDHIITQCFQEGKNCLVVMLDRITDVRNFGAIVRSAECAGVNAVVIPDKGGARLGGDAYKTSAGALSIVPICREPNLFNAIKYLKNSGLQVVACTEKASQVLYEADFTVPTVLLMGSEEDGIQKEYLKMADATVKIPMFGSIASLNVSVATGVILYEAVRQRTK